MDKAEKERKREKHELAVIGGGHSKDRLNTLLIWMSSLTSFMQQRRRFRFRVFSVDERLSVPQGDPRKTRPLRA